MMLYDVNAINVVISDPEYTYRLNGQVGNIVAHDPARPDLEYRQLEQALYLLGRQSHG